jgi:D-alanyl-lipoteichoic acid acyltransferase DltB (MBOAT superfamily)
LPLGISFFTFTQIAFLTDRFQRKIAPPNLYNYGLFITFFPHLMAGPILHHKDIMPQFSNKLLSWENIAVGLSIFSIGLFKKVIIADSLAPYADTIFDLASNKQISFIDAWLGSISYTFQLYFDFSGYSDMAIGLARLFGITFPLNFNSPYKSDSIISFWRRWHMTLSRFLRDYIYITFGGNRKGSFRRYTNLMLTMIIGGLWHGASWTFILWGALHGIYLTINHFWQYLRTEYLGSLIKSKNKAYKFFSIVLTFIAVMIGWVYFKAESISTANTIIASLFLGKYTMKSTAYSVDEVWWALKLIFIIGCIVFWGPNTNQLLNQYSPSIGTDKNEIKEFKFQRVNWPINAFSAAISALFFIISLLSLSHISEFLYYKF